MAGVGSNGGSDELGTSGGSRTAGGSCVDLGAPVEWGFRKANKDRVEKWISWDLREGWSANPRPGLDLCDKNAWPEVKAAPGGRALGLQKPIVWVLSMQKRQLRRHRFKKIWESLNLDMGLIWAPAIDGHKIPEDLQYLGKENARLALARAGMWASHCSHVAIMRETHRRCPDCDLLVFEDDVLLPPDFFARWQRFFSAVPADWDMLRLGGDSLWAPPLEATQEYYKLRSMGNMWGYVIRASSLQEVTDYVTTPPMLFQALSTIIGNNFNKLNSYGPIVPMVTAAGSACHDTGNQTQAREDHCETELTLEKGYQRKLHSWPQGYTRSYCTRSLTVQPSLAHAWTWCVNHSTAMECCPSQTPSYAPIHG